MRKQPVGQQQSKHGFPLKRTPVPHVPTPQKLEWSTVGAPKFLPYNVSEETVRSCFSACVTTGASYE
jgi:hypothetical protein